jgi:putative ABC transport system ATP-binding protein
MNVIDLIDISKSYGKDNTKLEVIKNLNFSVSEGEMIAIMGASGSGKSTLLNIIGCLDTITSGAYLINGENVQGSSNKKLSILRNKTFGFVVQYFALIDEYTVFQNIKVPLSYSNTKNSDIKQKIITLLIKLGIDDKKDKYPNQLSGGQNQRVSIARAIINNPKIILADEPTGALDKVTGDEVMDLFENLNKEGKTIIIVTHDEHIAKRCKRIISIEDGKLISDLLNEEILYEKK